MSTTAETTTFPYVFTLTDDTFTVFIRRRPHTVSRSSANWDAILDAVKGGQVLSEDEVIALVSPREQVAQAFANAAEPHELRLEGDRVFYGNELVDNAISQRLLDLVGQGFPAESFLHFANKVYANPWEGAREELYPWMEQSGLPIFPDGDLLAYKRVTSDYLDCHTSTVSNVVGQVVRMDRDQVDPSRRTLCSTGLHFCSLSYLGGFHRGSPIVLIKINPADVVSIPSTYESKGRCAGYEVVDEIAEEDVYDEAAEWPAQVVAEVVHEDAPDPEPEPQAPRRRQPNGKRKRPSKLVTVESDKIGRITKTRFKAMLKEHGSAAGIARAHSVSQGTVQSWKKKLGL